MELLSNIAMSYLRDMEINKSNSLVRSEQPEIVTTLRQVSIAQKIEDERSCLNFVNWLAWFYIYYTFWNLLQIYQEPGVLINRFSSSACYLDIAAHERRKHYSWPCTKSTKLKLPIEFNKNKGGERSWIGYWIRKCSIFFPRFFAGHRKAWKIKCMSGQQE
jgi:hypothetical protein